LDDAVSRHDGRVGVDAVIVHEKGRDDADGVTRREAIDVLAQVLDRRGGFVAEARGQARRFEIGARPEHRFSAIEVDRLNADAHLAALRIADREIIELHHLRSAGPMKPDHACHGGVPFGGCVTRGRRAGGAASFGASAADC
jgi:hypothetical protein